MEGIFHRISDKLPGSWSGTAVIRRKARHQNGSLSDLSNSLSKWSMAGTSLGTRHAERLVSFPLRQVRRVGKPEGHQRPAARRGPRQPQDRDHPPPQIRSFVWMAYVAPPPMLSASSCCSDCIRFKPSYCLRWMVHLKRVNCSLLRTLNVEGLLIQICGQESV